MKIPENPTPHGLPRDPNATPRTAVRAKYSADSSAFPSSDAVPASRKPGPATDSLALQIPSGWNATHLEEGPRLLGMLREGVRQLVASSPALQSAPPETRLALEQMLVQDPTVRQLLTEHLTQNLT